MWLCNSPLKLHNAKWKNNTDNKLDEQFLIIQASVENNKKDTYETKKISEKHEYYFTKIKIILKQMMFYKHNYST